MIPKKIHLCWFGSDDYPVEIKTCLESWLKHLPDYEIRLWNARDARGIGCQFIDEALAARQWAFAADAVRFYAVAKEGGIYLDSDIFIHRRFDSFIPEKGFATFHEHIGDNVKLQAAFFMGEKGNAFCREMFAYYDSRPFRLPDGSFDRTISPEVMRLIAEKRGWKPVDEEQRLDGDTFIVYPGRFVTPCKRPDRRSPDAFATHRVYGSWRKRRFGRRLELKIKHIAAVIGYKLKHLFSQPQLPR